MKLNHLFAPVVHSLIWATLLVTSCVTSSSENFASNTTKIFNSEPWLQDLEQLKKGLADTYPNLEWMIEHRNLNLPHMSQITVAKLKAATSDDEAKKILKDFLEKFGDPHLKIVLTDRKAPVSPTNNDARLTGDLPGDVACKRLGTNPKNVDFLFQKDANFIDFSTANDLFKIGIVKNGNKPIGFLRIHTFVSAQYPTVCAEEWNSFRSSISGACDDACQDVFMRDHLENRLLSELAKTLERLRAQNIGALILDLTHNGGGSSWEEGVREMLTSKNLTCGQTGFIRHPQWVQHFESKIFWKWRQRGSGNGA